MTPTWMDGDDRRLTLVALKDIAFRAIAVITESDPDANVEHADLIGELGAVVTLCEDAAMTAGELTLPTR